MSSHFASSSPVKNRNVAMVIHGCGVYDGTEIYEATSMLIHLSKQNVKVSIFAPNRNQLHVVNHLTGKPTSEIRNVLVESARLARGNVSPLTDLDVTKFDALVVPGGFGAAKNLSDFAEKGANCTVIEELQTILKKFHAASKPIGLCCIAPVLAARCLHGVEITMGPDTEDGACVSASKMGAKVIPVGKTDIHIDKSNKLVTTPAFMCGTSTIADIFDGIGNLVNAVVRL